MVVAETVAFVLDGGGDFAFDSSAFEQVCASRFAQMLPNVSNLICMVVTVEVPNRQRFLQSSIKVFATLTGLSNDPNALQEVADVMVSDSDDFIAHLQAASSTFSGVTGISASITTPLPTHPPSNAPSFAPSGQPSDAPSGVPSKYLSEMPSNLPSSRFRCSHQRRIGC